MKTTAIQSSAWLLKSVLCFSGSRLGLSVRPLPQKIEVTGRQAQVICRKACGYNIYQSLRAAVFALVDSSAYQQISLGQEMSVAFTAQGPMVYRCGAGKLIRLKA